MSDWLQRLDLRMARACIAGACCWAVSGPASALTLPLPPAGDLIGGDSQVTAEADDTLIDIAHRNGLGYEEIVNANPDVDPWLPGAGTVIRLPLRRILPEVPREGIVVNLPEHRLYYFPPLRPGEERVVISYPVSIGKMDWHTPIGLTKVVQKVRNPAWYPPESVRAEHEANGDPLPKVVPAGPDNPLGLFALRLGIPGGAYLIHGTNRPAGVGMQVTHGCMRLYPEDIEALFKIVPVGTPVRLINQPLKAGWADGRLYVEVHPPLEDADHNIVAPDRTALARLITHELRIKPEPVDWARAGEAYSEHAGSPVTVTVQSLAEAPGADASGR
jgi:L,D-transpeptidase ErfK/SrfK